MAHDVFISYASGDELVTRQACEAIEARGICCWIAPRNILPGVSYAEALIDAINQSSILLLIFSARSNQSPQVRREVERAVSKDISILPFKIDGTIPDRDMEYFISGSHWLDGSNRMHNDWRQTLAQSVADLLARRPRSARRDANNSEPALARPTSVPAPAGPQINASGMAATSPRLAPTIATGKGGGWRPRMIPQSTLWLNIFSDGGRDFHFSLTDSRNGMIVQHDRVQLQPETYKNLHGVLADLTSPNRLADRSEFQNLGQLLFRLVLPPAVQEALTRHGGPVSFATEELQLPWELLHDGGKFLCLSQPLARQPQTYQVANMLFGDDAPALGSGGRVLIIADPAGDLKAAAGEAEELRGLFHRAAVPCDTLIGPRECTYLNIMNRLSEGGYDIIHYSGHARTLPERQCSAIVLANQQLLMGDEICRVMRGNPVAFLNACHSSMMPTVASGSSGSSLSSAQNVRSLAQAFVHGNRMGRGRAVIGSMWWLNDDVARGLARSFYEELLRGQTLGESLRLARCRVEQTERDPALWSCYVLFGDSSLAWEREDAVTVDRPAAPAPVRTAPAQECEKKGDLYYPPKPAEPAPVPEPTSPDTADMGPFSALAEGPPWGDDTRVVLLAAVASMTMMNWPFLSTIHLLLGFTYLDSGILNAALRERDLNPDVTRRALRQVLAKSKRDSVPPGMTMGENLKKSLSDGKRIAREAGDSEVREHHLLRAMLEIPTASAVQVLQIIKVDVEALLKRVSEADHSGKPATTPDQPPGAAWPVGQPFEQNGSINRTRFSGGAFKVLEAAVEAAKAAGWEEVRGPHVFIGLMKEYAAVMNKCLQEIEVNAETLAQAVTIGSKPQKAATQSPRLHRKYFSDKAMKLIQAANQLAGSARPIGEVDIALSIFEDNSQYVTQMLNSGQANVRGLLAKIRGQTL